MPNSKPVAAKSAPVSVRLQPALNDQIAAIAAAIDRPKSWVIEQAIKDYVALEQWRLAAIAEGLKAADEGRVAVHEDVADWVRSWGRPGEFPPPKCG
ncbi:MAG TPA: CopG family ribbon-helix-helix protein [Caulobacteraceae bacterium]|jgi:predicted transcriptional regulator